MTHPFCMSPAMSGMKGMSGMLPLVSEEDPDPEIITNDLATYFDQPSFARSSGDPIPLTYPFSLLAWVKTTDNTSNIRALFTVGNDENNYAGLHINGGDFLARVLYAAPQKTDSNAELIADNTWHMVGVIVRNTNIQAFADGVMYGSPAAHTFTLPNTHGIIGIVARPAGTTNSLWGSADAAVDECMIFNDELTNTDLTELWNNSAGVLAQNIVSNAVPLTSGKKPIHAFPMSAIHANGRTIDVGTTGGHTLVESGTPTNTTGISAGTP